MYALSCEKCPLSLLCHTGVWDRIQGVAGVITTCDEQDDAFRISVRNDLFIEYVYPALRGCEHADRVKRYIEAQEAADGIGTRYVRILAPCDGSMLLLYKLEQKQQRRRDIIRTGKMSVAVSDLTYGDRRTRSKEKLRESMEGKNNTVDLQLCVLEMNGEKEEVL